MAKTKSGCESGGGCENSQPFDFFFLKYIVIYIYIRKAFFVFFEMHCSSLSSSCKLFRTRSYSSVAKFSSELSDAEI